MEKSKVMELGLLVGLIFMLSANPTSMAHEEHDNNLVTYIVHVKKPESVAFLQSEELHNWYHSFLPQTTHKDRMLFSYRNVASGFAVKLTQEEAKALQGKEEILSARPERTLTLHTTYTPSFLGLISQKAGLWNASNLGEGVIIGVIDTGINPLHPSFNDEGIPPPPAKWNGHCEFTGQRTCNNKLIGARNLVKTAAEEPPFENFFHGSHTAAEAAGGFVENASVFGQAQGTASGIAPNAHIAMYKVCNDQVGCTESAILAAMDIAIDDGVDVLSLSLGLGSLPFSEDPIAIGAFAAIQTGVFVSCSAANAGPRYSTLSNEAPWILTVGASTIDRKIAASAVLGNGAEYEGETLIQPNDFSPSLLPLVYAGANGNSSSGLCLPGSLDNVDIKGKVVICDVGLIPIADKGQVVLNGGGVAMILANPESFGFTTFAVANVLPSVEVSYAAGLAIKSYINSTYAPTATISFKGTVIGDAFAPAVVSFSSRGPSRASPGILKPDIIGPGLNILAAWAVSEDNKFPAFNIVSGTSMSCPHLAGVAALLKSAHPEWSPAAIKSAIMTTANTLNFAGLPIFDQRHLPADVFATGAGHVNPNKANDPGLVYDIQPDDYIPYLCGLGYDDREIGILVQKRVRCSSVHVIPEAQLNYPSFSVQIGDSSQYYTRTLTNVGPAESTYVVDLEVPLALGMSVNPSQITFTEVNQKATFSVEFIPEAKEDRGNNTFAQGSLTWVRVSDKHAVRIPISVIFK